MILLFVYALADDQRNQTTFLLLSSGSSQETVYYVTSQMGLYRVTVHSVSALFSLPDYNPYSN